MTHPDMLKVRPYWQYRHGETRRPATPRAQHVAWDGIVLRHGDPWCDSHYPPNDWFCSCGVRPVSRRDLARMGKERPDATPPVTMRKVVDPLTGDIHQVPEGVGFGWDHAPGKDWSEGLVPRQLQAPLDPLPASETRSPKVDLPELPPGRPFVSESLPAGQPPENYVQAFLHEFGADIGKAVLWRDAAGHALPISESLFQTAAGAWKIAKRGRETEVLKLAETLADPDEIWAQWARAADGALVLMRTYLRRAAGEQGFTLFEWSGRGWYGTSTFPPDRAAYLEGQRRGALLWRRPEEN